MEDLFERITNLILGNITWVIFLVFMLSGLIGGGKKKEEDAQQQQSQRSQQRRQPAGQSADNRPLAERMAEAFGMQEVMEEVRREQAQQQKRANGAQGRRSTTTGNVQDNYPELFGGSSMFDEKDQQWGMGKTKWGFDETEWGSTFAKNDEQWGGGFPERKSSEPTIEWPK